MDNRFKKTPCPKCGEQPRYIIGAFYVKIDMYNNKKYIGHPLDNNLHTFECGGGHYWNAKINKENDK